MRLLFAAGDVGGARALLPVARLAQQRGHEVLALAHGVLRAEGNAEWIWLDLAEARATSADRVLYATSVKDTAAFEVAEAAQKRGTPLLHMLDNWSSYRARLFGADQRRLIPDLYAVMDQLAHDEAVAEGVPTDILRITGHPNLASLAQEHAAMGAPDARRILFVSEPARIDSGAADAPGSRGYDEISVAGALSAALADLPGPLPMVEIAPHPREDIAEVDARWQALGARHGLTCRTLERTQTRAALHRASHVMGMSSILLYEAWLLGRPVASLQPGLRGTGLRSLAQRQGLIFCDKAADLPGAVRACLDQHPAAPRPDLHQHAAAADHVLDLIRH